MCLLWIIWIIYRMCVREYMCTYTHNLKDHKPVIFVFLTVHFVTDFYACAHLRCLGGEKAVHKNRLSFRALQGKFHLPPSPFYEENDRKHKLAPLKKKMQEMKQAFKNTQTRTGRPLA